MVTLRGRNFVSLSELLHGKGHTAKKFSLRREKGKIGDVVPISGGMLMDLRMAGGTRGVAQGFCASGVVPMCQRFSSISAKIRSVDLGGGDGAWCGAMKTPEVREARRLFLFGNGDGRRVLKVERLAELAGCRIESIRRHLPGWEAEAEEIAAKSSEIGDIWRLNAESLRKHESDKAFIRGQIDSQVAEIKQLPVLEKQLFNVAKSLADHNPEAAETAVSLIRAHLDTVASRKAAEAHLLRLQSHWAKMAGIESLQAVAETREKTLATGRAKLALRREEDSGAAGDGSQARPVGGAAAGGVFAKRSPAPVVDVGEVSDDEV